MPVFVIAIIVLLVLVVVVVGVVVAVSKKPAEPQPRVQATVPAVPPAPAPTPVAEAPKPAPAPEPARKPETLEAQALQPSMTDMMPELVAPEAAEKKPETLMAQALQPSMTDLMPELGAPEAEGGIGTDELPKFGTSEMPALAETATQLRYRTAAAQQLADAIESMQCPKCKAPTFVGTETPQEVGTDGMAMYQLEARCGACGHRAKVIDMKV